MSAPEDYDPKVVHPHACPKCGSENLVRRALHFERIEQPLLRLWNHYGGEIGVRAEVASDAPQTVVSAGVKDHDLRCTDCNHHGQILDFMTRVAPASLPVREPGVGE